MLCPQTHSQLGAVRNYDLCPWVSIPLRSCSTSLGPVSSALIQTLWDTFAKKKNRQRINSLEGLLIAEPSRVTLAPGVWERQRCQCGQHQHRAPVGSIWVLGKPQRQHLGQLLLQIICCLSEIWIYLGGPVFIWQPQEGEHGHGVGEGWERPSPFWASGNLEDKQSQEL